MQEEELIHWKTLIKRRGSELGFVAVGFTSAEPIRDLEFLLQSRMEQGAAVPFENQNIKQRIDPQANWQDCRTVIALAYPLPFTLPPRKGEGVIARSAVGDDYHSLLQNKIKVLVQSMVNKNWSGSFRWQVDTGPLVERAFALRAGLGWIGRNQQLIIPGYGSFVALALLFLDQTLEPDRCFSSHDFCGTCARCVEACPAKIIGQDTFAPKQCLSYLTQSKEILNREEQRALGLRIFGCDTCQEVCPHNQKRIREELENTSSLLRRDVDLLATLNLTKGEFQKAFRLTAAGWRGKGILQRNAFVAMLNSKDQRLELWLAEREKDKSIPPLIKPYLE